MPLGNVYSFIPWEKSCGTYCSLLLFQTCLWIWTSTILVWKIFLWPEMNLARLQRIYFPVWASFFCSSLRYFRAFNILYLASLISCNLPCTKYRLASILTTFFYHEQRSKVIKRLCCCWRGIILKQAKMLTNKIC